MKTEIIALLDRSGSMNKLAADVIGGFNAFLAEQAAQPGEARITYIQFNDQYDLVYQARPVAEALDLTAERYKPFGGTALRDALARTVLEQGKRIRAENWADQVIVLVNTDGEENSSTQYSQATVRAMVEREQEGPNPWRFIFVGANIDAFAEGANLGVSASLTKNFTASAAGVADTYAATGSMLNSLRAGGTMAEASAAYDATVAMRNDPLEPLVQPLAEAMAGFFGANKNAAPSAEQPATGPLTADHSA